MIDKFFIQTNDTIWDFLREIGKSKDIYSCYSFYEIDNYTLFFYATSTEIVLILLDIVDDGTVEYADKGVFFKAGDEKTLKYFRKVFPNGEISKERKDWRISPALELFFHAHLMRRFMALSCQFSVVPAIHLMYLTNSRIVNYPKIVETWQQDEFGFSALQNLSGLREGIIYDSRVEGHPFIPVNENLEIEGSEYWTKWQTYLRNRGHFDWDDYRYDDWPPPKDKRYSWKGEMGHLISDEFKDEKGK